MVFSNIDNRCIVPTLKVNTDVFFLWSLKDSAFLNIQTILLFIMF